MKFSVLLMASVLCFLAQGEERPDLRLWYQSPATNWLEAVPVGNGRLGGMVFGGVHEERIQLNEESVWAGEYGAYKNKTGTAQHITEARKLFFEGKYAEGEAVMQREVMSERINPRSYQTLGDLRIFMNGAQGEVSDYRRELDLDTAIATTRFTLDGVTYTREVFASAAHDVLVVHLTASKPNALNIEIVLDRPADAQTVTQGHESLLMSGQAMHNGERKGVIFEAYLRALPDGGTIRAEDKKLVLENANAVTLLLSAATNYNRADPGHPLDRDLTTTCQNTLTRAAAKSYEELRRAAIAEHRRLFRRVALNLGPAPGEDAPSDVRLMNVKKGVLDPNLVAL